MEHQGTRVINAFERYVIDIPDREVKMKHYCQLQYKTRFKEARGPRMTIY